MTASTRMRIPLEPEDATAFFRRALHVIQDTRSHIYFDTSFLMWMTTIGNQSRSELITWLKVECADRLHVPVWSAHEYLRHHIARTIPNKVEAKAQQLRRVARMYSSLRPFMDELVSPSAPTPSEMRTGARNAFTQLYALARDVADWKNKYESHATNVLDFINSYATDVSKVFHYMRTIRELGAGRYAGRLPPGFQDRGKKGSSEPDDEILHDRGGIDSSHGSNRWGDLILWKEILDHAKSVGAKNLVLLSNDRKNDWHYSIRGGSNLRRDAFCLRDFPFWTHPIS